ncbi:BppU family phage baseplate upper protein [Clostridioides difficile]
MNTKVIKLDLNKRLYDKIIAKQDDTRSRFLLFQLFDGALPFNLSNRSVRIYGAKPDGTTIFNDLTITHSATGFCLLELTNQMLAVAGIVKLELMVTEGDKKLTTIPFELEVIKKINSNAAIESSNEFSALLNALKEIDQWNREFADKSGKLEELYTFRLNEISEQMSNLKLNNVNIIVTDSPPPIEERVLKTFYFKVTDTQSIGQSNCNSVKVSPNMGIKIL